jgi:hypothetical protein
MSPGVQNMEVRRRSPTAPLQLQNSTLFTAVLLVDELMLKAEDV